MRKFKVDTLNDNRHIIVARLIEIEEIGPENFQSIITKDSNPEFIGLEPYSLNHSNFENVRRNNQVIILDLDKDFKYLIKNITDDNISKQIKLYIPSKENINLKIDAVLSDFFNENSHNLSEEYTIECPNCGDSYLEKYETCEICGYTRY